jgi:hypothetical protein
MTAVATPTVPLAKPPLPREHGAWGILLIPFGIATAVTGAWEGRQALLLASVLMLYLARASWLRQQSAWMWGLLAGSVVCGVLLVWLWRLWWLPAVAVVAVAAGFRKTRPDWAMQWVAVGGLTLTAPAAHYVARGNWEAAAAQLWALNWLYFAGGVLYVRMHIATAIARQPRGRAAVCGYHLALLLPALTWWPVGWCLLPAVARAWVGAARVRPAVRLARLGWTEVGHSLVFAVLAVALWGR